MADGDRPKLLTVEQAAEQLQISRFTMYGLIGNGAVRSVKIGKLRRIPPAALDDYIAELEAL